MSSLQHSSSDCARPHPSLPSIGNVPRELTQRIPPGGLKILVVDDEPMIREVLGEYLREQGHCAETAVDGREGLEKFRLGLWDVVLTDGLMPGMNGKELASAIKAINPATPVFLVSGSADLLHTAGEEGSPIDLVIRKPFTRQTVSAALATVRTSK